MIPRWFVEVSFRVDWLQDGQLNSTVRNASCFGFGKTKAMHRNMIKLNRLVEMPIGWTILNVADAVNHVDAWLQYLNFINNFLQDRFL